MNRFRVAFIYSPFVLWLFSSFPSAAFLGVGGLRPLLQARASSVAITRVLRPWHAASSVPITRVLFFPHYGDVLLAPDF